MSDTFDPNSWPRSRNAGGSQAAGAPIDAQPRNEDDDFDFDDEEINLDDFADDDFDSYSFDDDEPAPAAQPAAAAPTATEYPEVEDFDLDMDAATYPTDANTGVDEFDDDDDFGAGDAGQQGGYGRQSTGYDTGYDTSYDDGYGEYDDDDSGSGNKKKIIAGVIAALVLAAILIVGLITVFGGGNDAPTPEPATPNQQQGAPTGTATEAPEEVLAGMGNAFAAWGQYAVTGDLDAVRPYFVQGEGQWNRFEAEAFQLKQDPPGGDPLTFEMTSYQGFKISDGDWLIRGPVTSSREGSATENFNWEVRMVQESEGAPWKIKSVRNF